jgi:hypothetical protein
VTCENALSCEQHENYRATRGRQLRCDQAVAGQAATAPQSSDAVTDGEPGDAGMGDLTPGTSSACCCVEVSISRHSTSDCTARDGAIFGDRGTHPVDLITAAGTIWRGRDPAGEHALAARLVNPRAVDRHSRDVVIAASACVGGGMAAISAPIRSAASR